MNGDLDPRLREAPSPLSETLGFEMTGWSDGYARIEAPLADQLMNRQGLPHGGVYAAMLDTAMGFCGCYTGDPEIRQNALTLSMTVNFLSRATGSRLIAEARVTGGGRSTFFARAEVQDDTGARIAEATGVFKLRSSKTTTVTK
ncbi:PaaI family thioesterase [Roseovarius aestuariivivens]|uniref:PaaI family thioesterase n=1 Tax=Roseovarius aestuariivivens TaxID=1888910 RepID=UPI0010800D9F|nr:PaaI family thioesterase [Roseovarius aestuariivivens]